MTPNFQKIPFVRHREVLGAWASAHVHIIPRILRPAVFRGLYGFEQTAYDTLIPLGSSCFTAGVLREDGHRKFSLPLDWVANGDLFVRFDFLKTRFADFFHPERMVIRVDRINHAKQRTVEATLTSTSRSLTTSSRTKTGMSIRKRPDVSTSAASLGSTKRRGESAAS